MGNINISSFGRINFEYSGWKYYKEIKKKAMEQEFSWSGFFISMSIAFFIVIITASCLSVIYQTFDKNIPQFRNMNIYRLEVSAPESIENYINIEILSKEKIEVIKKSSYVA